MMDSFECAREYVASFHVYAGNPFLSQGEAELKDLALLRDAIDEAIAIHVRELVIFEGLSWQAAAGALKPSATALRNRYRREPGVSSE